MKNGPDGKKRQVALVLQGGGALGAYQAGVYQAMHEHHLTPDWVVGTSIGAINAALIAGNEHDNVIPRLKAFWDEIAQNDLLDMRAVPDSVRCFNSWWVSTQGMLSGVPGFYAPRWPSPFSAGLPVAPENASFYDTRELQATLTRLVDWEHLNRPNSKRLTVSAIKVNCGSLENFDNKKKPIGIEHIMASGALPPGFPPVRIDGQLYWDGGLYSNTPLEVILGEERRTDTLCFMVDLWSADGPEPTTYEQIQTRQKDVMFASRSRRHIEAYLHGYKLRHLIRVLKDKVPAELLTAEERKDLDHIGADTTLHIVRLAYAGRDWQMASKDINFSRGSIEWRWDQGYQDALRAIALNGWNDAVPEGAGVVVHEITSGGIHEESVAL